MHQVQAGPLGGFVGALVLLGASLLLARSLARRPDYRMGPADWVTLGRVVLVAGVAGLTASSFVRPAGSVLLVTLAAIALVLDGVDGWVARRTQTVSEFGARFDMEVDAFLILVLSVYAARPIGGWVLLIGAARYLFVMSGWVFPWLNGQAPPRAWCKVVAVIQGVVLTVVAAGVVPDALSRFALGVALVLLAESFGREAWQLWRARIPAGRGRVPIGASGALDHG